MQQTLKFQPFSSYVDISFWKEAGTRKLNDWRLDAAPKQFWVQYGCGTARAAVPRVDFADWSFDERRMPAMSSMSVAAPAWLHVAETAEMLTAIHSGDALRDPSLLVPALMVALLDLRHHRYLYWCCFPAVVPLVAATVAGGARPAAEEVGAAQLATAAARLQALAGGRPADACAPPAALLDPDLPPDAPLLPLAAWPDLSPAARARCVLLVLDPGTSADHPGWPLRNLLCALAMTAPGGGGARAGGGGQEGAPAGGGGQEGAPVTVATSVPPATAAPGPGRQLRVVLLRCSGPGTDAGRSLAITCSLPGVAASAAGAARGVGWEANPRGRPGPRRVDLAAHLDPGRLAESSADLNLRLMRWRMLPALDVDALARARCLLLGAGTLGCAVGRTLLGWGVRHVTFVDNGRVSYSNPARQSLFTFQDCANGGRAKAEAAAEGLRRVLPSTLARASQLTIPMPGHLPAEGAEGGAAAAREAGAGLAGLEALIQSHDLVFLLTDSRESRWLPTLLCAAHDVPLINVALGFDTFLVQRHGGAPGAEEMAGGGMGGPAAAAAAAAAATAAAAPRLGCYFCTDVVAPANSTRDRTLDQQCTVTRPGLAPIAGALAVELAVALLHHPARHRAPAYVEERHGDARVRAARGAEAEAEAVEGGTASVLGVLPHQIRGFLYLHKHLLPCTPAYRQCTACSPAVVARYRADGAGFVLRALREPDWLEDVTGLRQLREAVERLDVEWEEEEEEEGEGGDGEE